jgi:hemerythrin-like metal-binding protein
VTLIEWNAGVSVGFGPIDEQHKRLFDVMNDLDEAVQAGMGDAITSQLFAELTDYFVEHFETEEQYMIEYVYPSYSPQKEQHDFFVSKVKEFKARADAGQQRVAEEVLTFLRDWFLNHILKLDKELGRFLAAQGAK